MCDVCEIAIDYDDPDLREQVLDGSEDPYWYIERIVCGDTTFVGDGNSGPMKEYLTSFFGGLLQSSARCLDGQHADFTAHNGPLPIYVEPVPTERIRFGFAYKRESVENPAARESFEPEAVVSAETFVSEVLRSARELIAHVEDWNPELASSSADYRGIREDIDALEEAYENFEERGGF